MQTIYLDISNKGVVPTIYAKQGDVGRKFEVVFTNSGLSYVPPNGSVFSAWYSGYSGEGNYTDIGENSAFSINGNKVTVELITQMLTNEGSGILCLVLNESNGNQIGSWNVPYISEGIPGFDSEEAKTYYTAFSKAIENLKATTENLTLESIGAAPAGFGLGMERPNVLTTKAQVNALRAFGLHEYYGSESACDGIDGITQGSILTIPTMYAVTQYFFCRYPHLSCYLKRASSLVVNDGWDAWEWVNPPMVLGEEYRTTERYNGKPVYVKLVDFGTLPNSSYKNVLFYANDTSRPISVTGQCGADYNSLNMSIPSSSNGIDIFAINYTQIRAITNHDASNQYARALVKYWKTTD